jgi:FkbM family methyltransferase
MGAIRHHWRHEAATAVKRLVYGAKGEPYRVGDHTLRFIPGTRPVRLKHAASDNLVSRYDALQIMFLAEHVKPGMICLDVGGFYGQDALIMAALCGGAGAVFTFEPDPHARRMLQANIALNPGVRAPVIEPSAVWDEVGEATLYSRGGNANSALVGSAVGGGGECALEAFTVATTTLDAWRRDRGLRPDVVKLDIEGAEIAALASASNLLATDVIVLCELHPYAWPDFGVSFADLEGILRGSGRVARYLDGKSFNAATVRGVGGYGIVVLDRA